MQQKFIVLVHSGAKFTAGKPKILLKTENQNLKAQLKALSPFNFQ